MSQYRIQIVCTDKTPVRLLPGGKGERDLVQALVAAFRDKFPTARIIDAMAAKGVGVFRTEAQVRKAAHDVLTEIAAPLVRQAIYDSVRDVLRELKDEVQP